MTILRASSLGRLALHPKPLKKHMSTSSLRVASGLGGLGRVLRGVWDLESSQFRALGFRV